MKYVVWVSLGGERQGEYEGVEYTSLSDAKKAERKACAEYPVESSWIEEREV